jgi:hypothetical protein
MEELMQAILYGQLEVEIKNPSYIEQLEIVRMVVATPSSIQRLKISGPLHPWVDVLLNRIR